MNPSFYVTSSTSKVTLAPEVNGDGVCNGGRTMQEMVGRREDRWASGKDI